MRVTDASLFEVEATGAECSHYPQSGLLSLQVTLLGQIILKRLVDHSDETSQLVAPTLGIKVRRNPYACAAPGGKTTVHMAHI